MDKNIHFAWLDMQSNDKQQIFAFVLLHLLLSKYNCSKNSGKKCAIISIINQSRWRGCLPIRQWSMTSLPLLGDILVVSGNEAAINSETGRGTSFVLVTRNCWRNDQHRRCLNICRDHIQLLNKHFRVYGKKMHSVPNFVATDPSSIK